MRRPVFGLAIGHLSHMIGLLMLFQHAEPRLPRGCPEEPAARREHLMQPAVNLDRAGTNQTCHERFSRLADALTTRRRRHDFPAVRSARRWQPNLGPGRQRARGTGSRATGQSDCSVQPPARRYARKCGPGRRDDASRVSAAGIARAYPCPRGGLGPSSRFNQGDTTHRRNCPAASDPRARWPVARSLAD
jgi:hypothetical protein